MSEIEEIRLAVQQLSGHVLTMAKRMYGEDYDPDEDMDKDHMPGHEGAEDDYEDEPMSMRRKAKAQKARARKMPDDDEDMMPYDEDDEAKDKAKKSKARVANKGRQARKGFADSSETAKDEEDNKFGEKPDSDIDGNESLDPAGAPKSAPFSGDDHDETFNEDSDDSHVNLKAMMKSLRQLEGQIEKMDASNGRTIAKSIIPGNGERPTGRGLGETQVVTREMQEQAKAASWKELNRFREDIGDLPRHGIVG